MEKKSLYRKVNTKARGCHHHTGLDASYSRNTKKGMSTKMKSPQRGLDYTPLFRFLLSRVGKKWDDVYSEAVSRLDKKEPIFYMVEIGSTDHLRDRDSDYCIIENSQWSKLIIDDDGILQLKNPELKNEDFFPSCWCCTHTFNGKPLSNTYDLKIKKLNDPNFIKNGIK